jgi:hypothetical protein
MIPPVMRFAFQVHGGKLDGFHLPHGVKLQISVQLLYPCMYSHLGHTIKVGNLHLPSFVLKFIVTAMVQPGIVSKLELKVLI